MKKIVDLWQEVKWKKLRNNRYQNLNNGKIYSVEEYRKLMLDNEKEIQEIFKKADEIVEEATNETSEVAEDGDKQETIQTNRRYKSKKRK